MIQIKKGTIQPSFLFNVPAGTTITDLDVIVVTQFDTVSIKQDLTLAPDVDTHGDYTAIYVDPTNAPNLLKVNIPDSFTSYLAPTGSLAVSVYNPVDEWIEIKEIEVIDEYHKALARSNITHSYIDNDLKVQVHLPVEITGSPDVQVEFDIQDPTTLNYYNFTTGGFTELFLGFNEMSGDSTGTYTIDLADFFNHATASLNNMNFYIRVVFDENNDGLNINVLDSHIFNLNIVNPVAQIKEIADQVAKNDNSAFESVNNSIAKRLKDLEDSSGNLTKIAGNTTLAGYTMQELFTALAAVIAGPTTRSGDSYSFRSKDSSAIHVVHNISTSGRTSLTTP